VCGAATRWRAILGAAVEAAGVHEDSAVKVHIHVTKGECGAMLETRSFIWVCIKEEHPEDPRGHYFVIKSRKAA
jgi:hypothetical protein